MKHKRPRGRNLLAVSVLLASLASLSPSPDLNRPRVLGGADAAGATPLRRTKESQQGASGRVCGGEVCPRQILLKIHGEVTPQLLNKFKTLTERSLDDQATVEEVGNGGVLLIKTSKTEVESLLSLFTSLKVNLAAPNAVMPSGLIEDIEPNPLIRADAVPDDPLFADQWGLNNTGQALGECQGAPGDPSPGAPSAQVSAVRAWDCSTGSRANVVAVLDTGIDYTHPDLAGNIWTAHRPFRVWLGGRPIDCPAGSHGFNVLSSRCDPMDDAGHGTHVAGIIGARGNNRIGVAGVNWAASIMAVKFLDGEGQGCASDAVKAIDLVIAVKGRLGSEADVRVLNNSYEFISNDDPCQSSILQSAIRRAYSKNLLFVAGAGNDSSNKPHYPAAYPVPNVIAVAATDNKDNLWAYSNYGVDWVHLGAPGWQICSTKLHDSYGYKDGTSMAAPFVSGAAALLLSRRPSLDALGLKNLILQNVDLVSALVSKTITGGRLNVDKALRACGRCERRIGGRQTRRKSNSGVRRAVVTGRRRRSR